MAIKALLTGGTGMIGKALLLECLKNDQVDKVLVVGRSSCGMTDPKIEEVLLEDFGNPELLRSKLSEYNTAFFCMGISVAGLTEEKYSKITYDYTIDMAQVLKDESPDAKVTYVSGQGTDTEETSRMMWARVKGRTENKLLSMFNHAYMFRPGYIHPYDGLKSRTPLYNFFYFFLKPFYFLMKPMKNSITDTRRLSKAMINVVLKGYEKNILDPGDINKLGEIT